MNQGRLEEAKRTFVTCAEISDENLKDPHAHKSSVTSCLYNLGKLLHEQGHQEVRWALNLYVHTKSDVIKGFKTIERVVYTEKIAFVMKNVAAL